MGTDPSFYSKKIRLLSWALVFSCVLNIGVLTLLVLWGMKEQPPTPYFEHKPASAEQVQIPLADQRGTAEVLTQLSELSFPQLVNCLSHTQVIENGYAERDLALACLTAFHQFDIQRALPKKAQPQQPRLLTWKQKGQEDHATLIVYPDLNQSQFDAMIQFAKNERWPLTGEGLFARLKKQKEDNAFDGHLIETFVLTPEFWTVELLFNRSGQKAARQEILTILLEGDWHLLKQFMDQQRLVQDSSDARRRKFLLDYIKKGSSSASALLLKTDWDFAVKKLDDQQVLAVLKLVPFRSKEGDLYAKEMVESPRSSNVWKEASQWLYASAGEPLPSDWTQQKALARFAPEKNKQAPELVSKQVQVTTPMPLPIAGAKPGKAALKTKKSVQGKKEETSGKPLVYVVQDGDSLWKISRRFGVKVEELKSVNNLKTDVLKKGMTLKIPKK